MVMKKGLVLLVLCAVVSCGLGQQRTFSWLFPSAEPEKRVPIYKVHHYTGIHLQPLVPGGQMGHFTGQDVPEVEGEPPDVLEVEESPSALSSIGSLVSLAPGLLTGALGLSGGSSEGGEHIRRSDDIDRIGFASNKRFLANLKNKKTGLVTNLASSAVEKTVSKVQNTKNVVKGFLKGNAHHEHFKAGIYRYVPVNYPKHQGILSKIPVIRKIFGYSSPVEIPEIHLPYLPQLYSLPEHPNLPYINLPGNYKLPYKTGTYVKVKIPNANLYGIPSTSYGEPASPVPVPTNYSPPSYPEEDNQISEQSTPAPSTTEETSPSPALYVPPPPPAPELPAKPAEIFQQYEPVSPQPQPSYPYPPEVPEYIPPPPPLPDLPQSSVIKLQSVQQPYPPEGYPYPQSGYYETSETQNYEHLKPIEYSYPIYRHHMEPKNVEQNAE